MSYIAPFLSRDDLPFAGIPAWKDIESTLEAGSFPHCWAVVAPPIWHASLLDAMARMYLCDSGKGDDDCGSCRGWSRADGTENSLRHPDLIVTGEFGKAPNIEACRALIKELPLMPVVAKRRLGVVLTADKLLVQAANSLLKIAEEPPMHAGLLFLLEGNDFLPTLRSRSRFTTLAAPLSFSAKPLPEGEGEWFSWLEGAKEEADIPGLLASWASALLQEGDLERAARVEKLRLLTLQKNLSQNMLCDLIILTLKEEIPFEHIFGGIW